MEIESDHIRPRGRPRQFDRDAALGVAMRLFWQRGFEATSILDLAGAIGITSPSLYAAFGDKKQLFREAVRQYCASVGGFAAPAMHGKATARAAIESLLQAAAKAYTNDAAPRGCMVIHAGTNCAAEADDIAAELAEIRAGLDELIIERIQKGQKDGDVPACVDARELGLFYGVLLKGMSAQARDGASAVSLALIAKQAMASWPSA